MASLSSWISALRPRTLFLAIATTACGSGLAYYDGTFKIAVCVLTMLTATILQLLSNMSNDLGDFNKGTDITGERIGPERAVQSGAISPQEMAKGIKSAITLALLSGASLIVMALQFINPIYIAIFIALGIAAIVAALKYTSGKNPYGYKGLGDLFSFIFFGPVPVVGTYFLHTQSLDFLAWLPGIGLGLLSAAVLNINNMRDIENDRNSGKFTIPVRIGLDNAKKYHIALIVCCILCFLVFNIIYLTNWYQYLYIFAFIPLVKILMNILKITENKLLDPYLKYTSMSTFLLALLFCIFINL